LIANFTLKDWNLRKWCSRSLGIIFVICLLKKCLEKIKQIIFFIQFLLTKILRNLFTIRICHLIDFSTMIFQSLRNHESWVEFWQGIFLYFVKLLFYQNSDKAQFKGLQNFQDIFTLSIWMNNPHEEKRKFLKSFFLE